jgi:hypothetical protein
MGLHGLEQGYLYFTLLAIISVTVQLWISVFWVISAYFNMRNTLPKSGTFLLGHSVYMLHLRLNEYMDSVCIPWSVLVRCQALEMGLRTQIGALPKYNCILVCVDDNFRNITTHPVTYMKKCAFSLFFMLLQEPVWYK